MVGTSSLLPPLLLSLQPVRMIAGSSIAAIPKLLIVRKFFILNCIPIDYGVMVK